MRKTRSITIGISILAGILVLSIILGIMGNAKVETREVNLEKNPGTIYVGSGPGNDSTTIQGGINLAGDGATVFIWSGTYYENVVIDKTINLIGEDRETTIIDCGGTGDVVYISADWVNVSGFGVRNGYHGISQGWYSNNTIANCNVYNNSIGIYFHHSLDSRITNCIIYNNSYDGIHLAGPPANCTVTYCDIVENGIYGIYIHYCNSTKSELSNYVYHNNFINNTYQANDSCSNYWDNGYPSGGNYWSDFDEPSEGAYDNNTDGIVDTPYAIPGGSNVDNYPFISPSGWKEVGFTSHALIYINGNDDFAVQASSEGWAGNGTAENPYIIENYDINASSATGIYIQNTNVPFIIRNCTVRDGKSNWYNGICFCNTTNGKINNATSYNNWFGIDLIYSSNNTITNCTVYNNSYGIWLHYSSNNQITNCNVYNHSYGIRLDPFSNNTQITSCQVYNNYYGIELDYSSNSKFRNNILENNAYNFGVFDWVDIPSYYQDIDTSNTINGKPIYYIVEQNGLVFNETMNIGYLALISCSNIVVENLTLKDNLQGLLLVNTSYSIVTNCAVYNNSWDGIHLLYSSNNNITKCTVYNNPCGIRLYYSLNNEIHYNNIYGNRGRGIYNYNTESQYVVNATYNWWGDVSGPGYAGPGSGDNVTANVLYNPWFINPLDFTPPVVESTYPSDATIDVLVDADIIITFSKPMNTLTIPGNIIIEPEIEIQNYIWSNENKTLTLIFASELSSYTQYIITINTNVTDGVTDSDGVVHSLENMKEPYQFSFRTKDATPPEITNVQANPSAQEVYGYVNITAFVSDNAMVNLVYVNIIYPNGTLFGNFSMTGIGLDANKNGTYYYNTTYSAVGTYSYHIWAVDTSGNANKSSEYIFTITKIEVVPPVNWLLYIGLLAGVITLIVALVVIARLRKKSQ